MQGLMTQHNWLHPAPAVWLLECDATVTDAQLDEFATWGFAIGPEKVGVDWQGQ